MSLVLVDKFPIKTFIFDVSMCNDTFGMWPTDNGITDADAVVASDGGAGSGDGGGGLVMLRTHPPL